MKVINEQTSDEINEFLEQISKVVDTSKLDRFQLIGCLYLKIEEITNDAYEDSDEDEDETEDENDENEPNIEQNQRNAGG